MMPQRIRIFVYAVIAIVAAAVTAGFFVAGTPQEERLRQFDERRVNDLQSIQWQIVNYWQSKERLPENLGVLRDDIGGYVPPRDPETGAEYDYAVNGPLTFTLCASFALPSGSVNGKNYAVSRPVAPERVPTPASFDTWQHESGRACFERTIDKDLYPPRDKGESID